MGKTAASSEKIVAEPKNPSSTRNHTRSITKQVGRGRHCIPTACSRDPLISRQAYAIEASWVPVREAAFVFEFERRVIVWAAFVSFLASLAPIAHADAPLVRAELEWHRGDGAESCIDGATLASRVEARLDRRVFVPTDGDVRVMGRITAAHTGDGFFATLTLEAGGHRIGTRELSSARAACAALEESLALMLALLVDVTRDEIQLNLPDESASTEASTHEPWRGGARILASIGSGTLPDVAWVFHIQAWIAPPGPFSIEIGASHSLEATRSVMRALAIAAAVRRADLGLCLDARPYDWLAVGACARGEAGLLSAAGHGFDEEKSTEMPWFAVGVGGRARFFPVPMLEIYVGLDLLAPLIRDRFVAEFPDGIVIAHTPDEVAVRGMIGLGFSLP
jgi:hypothetical protein